MYYYKVLGNLASSKGVEVVKSSSEEVLSSFKDATLQKVGNCCIHIMDADYNGCKFIGKKLSSLEEKPEEVIKGMYDVGCNMFGSSKDCENVGATLDYLLEEKGIRIVLMYGMAYGELFIPFEDGINAISSEFNKKLSNAMFESINANNVSSYEVSPSDLLNVKGVKDFVLDGLNFFVLNCLKKSKDLKVNSLRFILNCGFNGTKVPRKYYKGYNKNYTLEDWNSGSEELQEDIKGYREVYLYTC